VGIYAKNRPEWLITALACQAHSMPIVPLYDTLGPNAAEYIINHAELSIVVVGKENLSSVHYTRDFNHSILLHEVIQNIFSMFSLTSYLL
jgi:long-chain acyl-CoA synthetase